MSSYQFRKSYCGDKTVVRSSYLHNGISYVRWHFYIESRPRLLASPGHQQPWSWSLDYAIMISTICDISVLRDGKTCKYDFIFPKNNFSTTRVKTSMLWIDTVPITGCQYGETTWSGQAVSPYRRPVMLKIFPWDNIHGHEHHLQYINKLQNFTASGHTFTDRWGLNISS